MVMESEFRLFSNAEPIQKTNASFLLGVVGEDEDDGRNAEQRKHNGMMRDALRKRRRVVDERPREDQVAPEEMMRVDAAVASRPHVAGEGLPPWFEARPHIDNVILRLHEELLDLMNFMKHQQEEVEARESWVTTIGTCCRTLWPDCQVHVFGSYSTGLSLPNGDVDVAILDVPCEPAIAMKMLANHMLGKGEISWLEIIESAKVPVCKLRSQTSGLRADVVINRPDGVETSRFIREQCLKYPQMKPLLVFLKYFLLQRGLHETYTGGMGSYLCCNVVLHFLQKHQSRLDSKVYAATSLGHLLFDLFKYYSQEFQYETQGISVLNGGKVFNREERGFGKGKGKGKDKGKGKGKGKGKLSLCLESPMQPSVDLGGACYRINVLKNLFHHAFHCLCHLMVTCAPVEASLLCPLLLDPSHPVITHRNQLLAEQPVALAGLPSAKKRASGETGAPATKRPRVVPASEAATV